VAGVIWLASETRRTIHPAGSLWGTNLHQLELLHGRAGPRTRARPILVRVRQLNIGRDKKSGEIRQSPIWWIAYSVRGSLMRESAHTSKEAVASRLLRKRLGEIA